MGTEGSQAGHLSEQLSVAFCRQPRVTLTRTRVISLLRSLSASSSDPAHTGSLKMAMTLEQDLYSRLRTQNQHPQHPVMAKPLAPAQEPTPQAPVTDSASGSVSPDSVLSTNHSRMASTSSFRTLQAANKANAWSQPPNSRQFHPANPPKTPLYRPVQLRNNHLNGGYDEAAGAYDTMGGEYSSSPVGSDVTDCGTVGAASMPQPKRSHWRNDYEANACESPSCNRTFTLLERRHHCRRCGEVFCSRHSGKRVRLDQNARFHPRGHLCRACDLCAAEYQEFVSSMTSQNSESPVSKNGTEVAGISYNSEPSTPSDSTSDGRLRLQEASQSNQMRGQPIRLAGKGVGGPMVGDHPINYGSIVSSLKGFENWTWSTF